MLQSELLADLIWIFHLALIAFVITTPFRNNQPLLLFNLILMVAIVTHWITNNQICCLTVCEKMLRGKTDDNDTFFGKLISPVYKFANEDTISHGIMGGLIVLTLIRIRWKEAFPISEVRKIYGS